MFEIPTWHSYAMIAIECLFLATIICLIAGLRWGKRGLFVLATCFATAAWAANTSLSNLSAVSSVGGTDLFYDVQSPGAGGLKATAAQIATYVTGTLQTTGSWTPADASGASLTFTSVNAKYTKIGNMVFAYALLAYPVTADGSGTAISGLPVAAPNQTYAQQCSVSYRGGAGVAGAYVGANTSTMHFVDAVMGGTATNSLLSGQTVSFICIYPAT